MIATTTGVKHESSEVRTPEKYTEKLKYYPIIEPKDIAHISLEKRLDYLHIRDPSFYEAYDTIGNVADNCGVSVKWIRDFIESLDDQIYLGEDKNSLCPDYVQDLVFAEVAWQGTFADLPENISRDQMLELVVNHGYDWISKVLKSVGARPINEDKNRVSSYLYPKDIALLVRKMSMEVPPADDYVSLTDIIEAVPFGRLWVQKIIDNNKFPGDTRLGITGVASAHYSREVKDYIVGLASEMPAPAGGEWVTIRGMSTKLGRTHRWINKRLKDMYDDHSELVETRLDAMNRPQIHYPVSVLYELKVVSEYEKSLPEIGDYLAVPKAAKRLHTDSRKIRELTDENGITLKLRRNRSQLVVDCLSPEDIFLLSRIVEEGKPSSFRHTAERLTRARQEKFEAYCLVEDIREIVRGHEATGDYGEGYKRAVEELILARRESRNATLRLSRAKKSHTEAQKLADAHN